MEAETPPSENVKLKAADFRGIVNRHRAVAIAVSLLTLLGAASFLTWFYWPAPDNTPHIRAWYTTDDGKTWFEDAAERIPPFEHDGKPAVRLHLFTCDRGKTTFVGYLEKLPEEVFKKFQDKGIDLKHVDDDELAADSGWLAKRLGDAQWTNSKTATQAYRQIVSVRCPDGENKIPDEVYPKNPGKR